MKENKLARIFWISLSILFHTVRRSVHADDWGIRETTTYYSSDSAYQLRMIPGTHPKYILDGTNYSNEKFAYGTLTKINENSIEDTIWRNPLRNRIAPLFCVISKNGEYVITADDWGGGSSGLKFYGADGDLLKEVMLKELFDKQEIAKFPQSITKVWWLKNMAINSNGWLELITNQSSGIQQSCEVSIDYISFLNSSSRKIEAFTKKPLRNLELRNEKQLGFLADNEGILEFVELANGCTPNIGILRIKYFSKNNSKVLLKFPMKNDNLKLRMKLSGKNLIVYSSEKLSKRERIKINNTSSIIVKHRF